uniref:Uncharacterized protein n=1 Tax=Anguilla anguilla TaxID=7936 RepID=A0A0E9UK00_ANGAN
MCAVEVHVIHSVYTAASALNLPVFKWTQSDGEDSTQHNV